MMEKQIAQSSDLERHIKILENRIKELEAQILQMKTKIFNNSAAAPPYKPY